MFDFIIMVCMMTIFFQLASFEIQPAIKVLDFILGFAFLICTVVIAIAWILIFTIQYL